MNSPIPSEYPPLSQDEEAQIAETAIQKARRDSFFTRQRQEYWDKLAQADPVPDTPALLWKEVMSRGNQLAADEQWERPFTVDDHRKPFYTALCLYFTGDPAMADYNLSPKKGLMLYGNVGVGKSIMLRLLERNAIQSYKTVSCRRVAERYSEEGEAVIQEYSNLFPNQYRSRYYNQEWLGCFFDDLGTERDGKFYGKGLNAMEEILQNRYDNMTCRGPKTHLTSNLSLKQLEDRYGLRVIDRLYQLFNLIEIPKEATNLRR